MAIDEAVQDDPIISQYQVFWNDPSPKQVIVLQFPNRTRDKPYNARNYLQPTRMRLKPNSGFIEIDVPLDTQIKGYFSDDQARKFGQSLSTNSTIQNGGSFGLAGGFGIGSSSNRAGQGQKSEPTAGERDIIEDKDSMLTQLTLSGKIQWFKEGDPIYVIATFKGDECHLTRVHAICSLSPYNMHLDAIRDNEKAASMRNIESVNTGAEARAVTMRTANVERGGPEDIGETLRALQEEEWTYLQWIDEDDNQSYTAFQDQLFYKEASPLQQLVSAMSPSRYLDAISAPKSPKGASAQVVARQYDTDLGDDWDHTTDEEDTTVEVMQEEGMRRQMAVD